MNIYPYPHEFLKSDNAFNFSGNLTFKFNEEFKSEKTIPLFQELWNNFTSGHCNITFEFDPSLEKHSFSSCGEKAALKSGYEYAFTVTPRGISASATSDTGLIHAMCTILQLIKPQKLDNSNFDKFYINCAEINDKPSLEFRCFHSAVTRGSLNLIKQTVRLCGLMKYSHILFEFFGSIKFDCMKELAFEDAYSKEEIKPLIDEAHAFGMEILPMFNHLGHAACAANGLGEHVVLSQNSEKATLFEDDGWTFCVSNPEVKQLQKQIRRELIELCGDGKYFHIGADEAYSFGTCDLCSKTRAPELFADYVNEIAAEMKPLGRRVIIWAESMLDFNEWEGVTDSFGHKYEATEGPDITLHKALDLLDKSVILNDWQYTIWDEDVKTLKYFRDKGFDVIPASAEEVKNTDALCKGARKFGGLGLMQTVWNTKFYPITIVRGGTSSWMENIDEIDKDARGRHNFVHEYMIMNHTAGTLVRKMMPEGKGIFRV